MDKKKRLIFFGAAALILIAVFFAMSLYSANQKLNQENAALFKEAKSLKDKNDSLASEYSKAQNRIRELSEQLDKIQREMSDAKTLASAKEELQKKYDAVVKEKNELADRLKKQQQQPQPPAPAPRPQISPAQPTGLSDDLFLAGVLKEKTNLEFIYNLSSHTLILA